MATHKNKSEAISNYCIYAIFIDFETFKIGKADLDAVTKEGTPIRIQSQINFLGGLISISRIKFKIFVKLYNTTTKEAKKKEKEELDKYYEKTGTVPPGNKNSYNPPKENNK